MQGKTCLVCGTAHWSTMPCATERVTRPFGLAKRFVAIELGGGAVQPASRLFEGVLRAAGGGDDPKVPGPRPEPLPVVGPVPKKRGRPPKEGALTPAQKQAAYRERKKRDGELKG